jgi:sortase A
VAAIQTVAGLAVLALWLVFFLTSLSGLQASRSQQLLYNQLREHLADATEPIGGVVDPGTPIALLEAPRIGMRYVVVEGTAPGDLRNGPGHRRNTALPGQGGVSVIYGRALTYGAPFRHITDLRAGDTIRATTGQGVFEYRVDGVRRDGDPVPEPLRTGAGRLTLATAEGTSWRVGWAPDVAVYVDATLQNTAAPAPAGRPTAVPRAELAMGTDTGALVPLVLWLQVLLLAVWAATWGRVRWGGGQTWLVAMPVLLFALWQASDTIAQLLPNLF